MLWGKTHHTTTPSDHLTVEEIEDITISCGERQLVSLTAYIREVKFQFQRI